MRALWRRITTKMSLMRSEKSENRVLDIDELAQVTGGKDVVIDEYNKKKRPPIAR